MKRKGTGNDEEQDKKRSAVSEAAQVTNNESATSFTLSDFADEVLVHVYSFLNFKDRQVSRRGCRRLLEFVDKCTPGAEQLEIVVRMNPSVSRSNPENGDFDSISIKPSHFQYSDSVSLMLEAVRQPRQGEYTLSTLRSRLPPLRSIRPKKLCLEIDLHFYMRGLFALILQLLVEEQVARSVSSAQFCLCAPLGPEPQLREALSTFDHASQSGVQRLTLVGRSDLLISLPLHLPRLVALSLDLGFQNISVEESRRALLSLSAHPSLRELRIINHQMRDAMVFATLTAFANLQKLDMFIDCNPNSMNREDFFIAFGNMLRLMTSLEYLNTLIHPLSEFWEYVVNNNITSSSLQELGVHFSWIVDGVDDLDAMVHGLLTFAPNLRTLLLGNDIFVLCRLLGEEDTIRALSALRHHPTLTKLQFCRAQPRRQYEEKALMSRLQQALGTRVKVASENPVPF